ncbi:NUDIX hydrolase [Devriesea agamarum]|uniref:NUDIX hydrolase n=1 Tax=Devriesea agamarum TaxID=472569 RepID=UPI00071E4ECF|nr:NUDIX hydrolase [Devriesea agamarum]
MPSGFDTRLAAYGVIVRDQQILLARWVGAGSPRWTLPGGGVELDETLEEGVIREIREETGYQAELDGVIGVRTVVIPSDQRLSPEAQGRPLKGVGVIYRARVVGGQLVSEIGGSTDCAAWIPLREVVNLPRVELVDQAFCMAGLSV